MTNRQSTARGGYTVPPGWTPRLILSTIFLAMVLEALALGAGMVSLGLPSILREFPTDQGGWLLTAYLLAGAVAAPLLGKFADLYGKRRILLLALLVSATGAVICAVAPTFEILIAGRALQGVILTSLSLTYSLIRDVYPPKPAAMAASITVTGMGAFAVVMPLLVGILIDAVGFRGLFWFDATWTLALCGAVWLTTPESPLRRVSTPDLLGGALLAGGIGSMLTYVSMGNTWGWTSSTGLLLAVVGALLLAGFVVRVTRVPDPIVNLKLFTQKPLLFVTLTGAVGYGLMATTSIILPFMSITPKAAGQTYGLGLTTTHYALIESPKALVTVAAGLVIGIAVARGRHPRGFMIAGLAAWIVGQSLLAFRNDTVLDIVTVAVIFGLGVGFVNASLPNLVIRATPAGDQGSTAGAVQLCQTATGALMPVLLFAVLAPHAMRLEGGGVIYAESGFRTWLLIAAGLAAVTLVVATTVLWDRSRTRFDVASTPTNVTTTRQIDSISTVES